MLKVISNITKDIQDTFSFKIWFKAVEALEALHTAMPESRWISDTRVMSTRKSHCPKDNKINQGTYVKSDIKYYKRHLGHSQQQELVQGTGSIEDASS